MTFQLLAQHVFVDVCTPENTLRYVLWRRRDNYDSLVLSQEIRKQVIVLRYEQRRTAQEIADIVGCNERTVYNILRLYRDFGQVNDPFASRSKGRPRTLGQGDLTYITSVLDANPSLYLNE